MSYPQNEQFRENWHEAKEEAKHKVKSKMKKIKEAVKAGGRTMHAGKKAAPGITYSELNPKEKYYRKSHQARSDKRLDSFFKTGYGRYLDDRAERRGERDL